jgi:hypothetical protein
MSGEPTRLDIIGTLDDYGAMLEFLKDRMRMCGLTYDSLDALAGLSDGHSSKLMGGAMVKMFGIMSLLAVTRALGIKGVFLIDQRAAGQMREHWGEPVDNRRKASRRYPIGKATIDRVMPAVAREMGRRGGCVRGARHALLSEWGRAGGKARWKGIRREKRRKAMQAVADARWKSPRGIARAEHRLHLDTPKGNKRTE